MAHDPDEITVPSAADFREADAASPDDAGVEPLGEALSRALDLGAWSRGEHLLGLGARLQREVEAAVRHESGMGPRILSLLEQHVRGAEDASRESGLYTVRPEDVVAICRHALFNGLVEACDGTRFVHDTLPITVVQMGVCLTSYAGSGDGDSIVHRFYRHDLTEPGPSPEDEVIAFIAQRALEKPSGALDEDGEPVRLTTLRARAVMTFAERAMLAERSDRPWRMGHGSPLPFELLTGSGSKEVVEKSLPVLEALLDRHKRVVFVPSAIGNRAIRTIASALRPLQYAVLRNTRDVVTRYLTGAYDRPGWKDLRRKVEAFRDEVCRKIVVGVYRAGALCPGSVFWAHEDHVHEAALIAIADSTLQEHRGFPNLIDVADRMCRGMFEPSLVAAQVEAVLSRAGAPYRYLLERSTRA